MKFNKIMIDTFQQIKDTQTTEEKPSMKLSAPDIGDILVKIYHETNDVHTKALITIFMREAGESWSNKLEKTHKLNKLGNLFSVLKNKSNKSIS